MKYEEKDQHDEPGCLSTLFIFIAHLTIVYIFCSLLNFKFTKEVPIIGKHPIIYSFIILFICAEISNSEKKFNGYFTIKTISYRFLKLICTAKEMIIYALILTLNFDFIFLISQILSTTLNATINNPLFKLEFQFLISYLNGYMISRLILRILPHKIDDYKNYHQLKSIFFLGGLFLFIGMSFKNDIYYVLNYILNYSVEIVVILYSLYYNNLNQLYNTDKPFVLFLRRFNGFSDRSLLASIYSGLPYKMSIAFLISSKIKSLTWDPFLVLFHGNKFGNLRNLPHYIISQNDSWEKNVKKMAINSKFIFIDISEFSESILIELKLLKENNLLKKTIFLSTYKQAETNLMLKENSVDFVDLNNVNFIYIEKSWIRALPKIFFGLLFMILNYISIYKKLLLFPDSIFLSFMNGVSILFCLIIFILFFMKPTISKKMKVQMKRFILERSTIIVKNDTKISY